MNSGRIRAGAFKLGDWGKSKRVGKKKPMMETVFESLSVPDLKRIHDW